MPMEGMSSNTLQALHRKDLIRRIAKEIFVLRMGSGQNRTLSPSMTAQDSLIVAEVFVREAEKEGF